MTIPVMRPRLPRWAQVAPYLERMDTAGWYSNFGALVRELEGRYADLLGVPARNVVTVSNATAGLIGAASLAAPTTWLVPAWTFAATGHAIVAAGGVPLFRDIQATTWRMDVAHDTADAAVGLMPVIPFGSSVRLDEWSAWPTVVIDAAASLGSLPDLSPLPHGWSVVFSLHATKALGCGEGGLVVCGDPADADRLRAWTNFGFDDHRNAAFPATNAKMSEMTAAYGLTVLDEWPNELAEWTAAAELVDTWLEGLDPSPASENPAHPYALAVLPSATAARETEDRLARAGVQTRRWWPALLTDMPAFAVYAPSHAGGSPDYPVARDLCDRVLALPKFRGLSAADSAVIRAAMTDRA